MTFLMTIIIPMRTGMTEDRRDIGRTTALMRTGVLKEEGGTIQTARMDLMPVLCTEPELIPPPLGIFLLVFPSQGLQTALLVLEFPEITPNRRARITPHL